MTAFEITFTCIFAFIAFLLLVFTIVGVTVAGQISKLVGRFNKKVHNFDHCFHGEEHEEFSGVGHLMDVADHVATALAAGMEMWKHYRRRKR